MRENRDMINCQKFLPNFGKSLKTVGELLLKHLYEIKKLTGQYNTKNQTIYTKKEAKMYTLNLTHEQQQALQALLECSISDIHSQIVRADSHGFKQALKGRKEILIGMLDAVKQVQTATA